MCPSSGGIGIRLKIARTRLIIAKVRRKVEKGEFGRGLKILLTKAVTKSIRIFERGPAKEVKAVPSRSLSKFLVLIGTGLLHPNLNRTIHSAPRGSI